MSGQLEQALAHIDCIATDDDWILAATLRGLIRGYDTRWREAHAEIEIVEVEGCYQSPLVNIETGRSSRTWMVAGKLDKIVRINGETVLIDHKTTSSDISDPTGSYWRQLAVDSQAPHYELLLLANNVRLDRIVWDVVRKPGIAPKQITKADHKQTLETSEYCGFAVTPRTLKYLAENQRENGELYSHRLANEAMDDPDRYFARRSVSRTRDQLGEYANELWQVGKTMRAAEMSGEHFRNSGACFNYGRPCPYLNLCAGADSPDSDRWQKKPAKNPELPEWIGGQDVLTNSRVRTFQTCRRLHHYKYNLAIEPASKDREEALYFGSAWHEVLDVYWLAHGGTNGSDVTQQQPSCSHR